MRDTSWNKSGKWYNKIVGEKGHYYHQTIVVPRVLQLLGLSKDSELLDLGCGQGVLARSIDAAITYVGIDLARSLVDSATSKDKNVRHRYIVADATKRLSISEKDFTHATAILSLQNMEFPQNAIRNAGEHLQPNGVFVMVLNHPSFRIPRQSGWGIGENKLQYRYENRYMSFLKIPITMHPGEKESEVTWSFHYPLSFYTKALHDNGFVIEVLEEWVSEKESQGKVAKMENRARSEFPLFLAIKARKVGGVQR